MSKRKERKDGLTPKERMAIPRAKMPEQDPSARAGSWMSSGRSSPRIHQASG
jgi:hypothetical protein